ncbi:TIGR04283 family arsenosugar biosynthesis glycosyltransferase [Pelovirga terrestris]|uniref:TIGR04283 family arsenosugar biosynthesis glycosyltransferase n=1 Tax=Pelovirga terrestris TaxID=2771352 RepID=A0A8J6URA3_9BACT|nr:TIGR04283 family arsenosugar biosynthesis glycosyltransferase [Pelovirga terrestris]MBD1400936.1 TIGR04283 family arsenosugar biosynthesis glycosyltransferase [Pelovirga terrestris]
MEEKMAQVVELSVIVPVLNEAAELPTFLADLRRQRQVTYELIIVDGGSTDATLGLLQSEQVQLISAPRGRGHQLNAGAAKARGDWLLFLHVDSRFDDPLAWRNGMDCLARSSNRRIAGHFSLNFWTGGQRKSQGYDFYQRKARSSKPETIHGDQGFLLHRTLKQQVGDFRTDLPVMEDTDFAERLRAVGQWQLLPAVITTSIRRFAAEGLWQRQLLGALMMCFRHIGWYEFFDRAPAVYRLQTDTECLRLAPFFDLIAQLLATRPVGERWKLWLASGSYVRRHGWQLFFAADCRRAFRQGRSTRDTPEVWQFWGVPIYDWLTDNLLGRVLAALTLRLWFAAMRSWLHRNDPA